MQLVTVIILHHFSLLHWGDGCIQQSLPILSYFQCLVVLHIQCWVLILISVIYVIRFDGTELITLKCLHINHGVKVCLLLLPTSFLVCSSWSWSDLHILINFWFELLRCRFRCPPIWWKWVICCSFWALFAVLRSDCPSVLLKSVWIINLCA